MGIMDFLRWPGRPAGAEPAGRTRVQSQGYEGPDRRGSRRRNPRQGTRILVVDDSATVLVMLKRMLHQAGVQTITASSGEEALDAIRDTRPDAILLDIVMPGTDGFSVLRQLRRNEATRNIPVVMMSGNEQATEQFYVQRIGADDFMKKPFGRADVFGSIERLLDPQGVPVRQQSASGVHATA